MGEVGRSAQLRKLKQDVTRKITFLRHKAVIDYRDVYTLIRDFFKTYLQRPYEFTISELREEMRETYVPVTVRDHVNKLLNEIEHMEYKSVTYSREELTQLLNAFEHVVSELIKVHVRRQSFFEKIRSFLFHEEPEPLIISELPAIERDDELHVHLNMLLEKTYFFMSINNKQKAKKQYLELTTYYNQVPDDIKREFYPLIDEAYTALVEAHKK